MISQAAANLTQICHVPPPVDSAIHLTFGIIPNSCFVPIPSSAGRRKFPARPLKFIVISSASKWVNAKWIWLMCEKRWLTRLIAQCCTITRHDSTEKKASDVEQRHSNDNSLVARETKIFAHAETLYSWSNRRLFIAQPGAKTWDFFVHSSAKQKHREKSVHLVTIFM